MATSELKIKLDWDMTDETKNILRSLIREEIALYFCAQNAVVRVALVQESISGHELVSFPAGKQIHPKSHEQEENKEEPKPPCSVYLDGELVAKAASGFEDIPVTDRRML